MCGTAQIRQCFQININASLGESFNAERGTDYRIE